MKAHWLMGLPRVLMPVLVAAALLGACGAPPAAAPTPRALRDARICTGSGLRPAVLLQVNAARAAGVTCGRQRFAPAPSLAWNDALASAAARHSADMARRDFFDHATPEGQRVAGRVTAEGYPWRVVGENIAGGDRGVDEVMRGWMASASHCANIMNPEFQDIGLACAERGGTTWGTYWTMVLGRRR